MSESTDTRTELLEAAFSVLVNRGYDGFTTQAVADEAGRNQSLVHYHFDTKRDLLRALVEHSLGNLEEEITATADDEDPADRLLTLAEYMIAAPDDTAVAFRRVLLELRARAPHDEGVAEAMGRDRAFVEDFVAETVRDGVDRGQFRDVDVEAFATTFVDAIIGAQTTTAAFGDREGGLASGTTAADGRTAEQRAVAGLRNIVDTHLRGEAA